MQAGILLSAALALTGCAGGAATGNAASVWASTKAATVSTPKPTATPTPTPVKTYTNKQLAAIITELEDANGQPMTIMPAAQIDQGLIKAKELRQNAVVTPAACADIAANNNGIPEGTTYAAGESISMKEETLTVVSAVGAKSPSLLAGNTTKMAGMYSKCSNFTVQSGGMTLKAHVQPLGVKTTGDHSAGVLITQTTPTGDKVTTLVVSGSKSTLGASAIKMGAAVTPGSAPELVKLVDAVLAKG